jgi:Tol biopolymer transport system component
MKSLRGFGAGVCLALVLAGCSDSTGTNDKPGVYSPLIINISADHEPAIRGLTNQLTVVVTNVNNLPITYHWSAAAGTLLDSTSATVGWTAPDSVGTYDVTASIEAVDGDHHFFDTTTFHVFVDNEYDRWTNSPEVQFDPAPVPSPTGGIVFAQYSNISNGQADIWYIPAAGLAPEQRTTGFFTANSPTMKADGSVLAFAARPTSDDSQHVYVSAAAGANPDPTVSEVLTTVTTQSHLFGNPRFSRAAGWLLYNSDSGQATAFVPRLLYRDIPVVPPAVALPAPARVIEDLSFASRTFWMPNWGPDIDADGRPDSVVTMSFRFFRAFNQISNGLYKFATSPPATSAVQWLPDSSASDPDWSPDGQYIVFADPNTHNGERDIWIIRSDTNLRSAAIRVTSGPADDSHPRFSSDGNTIYFISNRTNNYGLNGVFTTERRGYNIWGVTRFDRP